MTSAQMLSRLRFLLDEASASFWADADLYTMLSDGQREVANYGLKLFNSLPYQQKREVGRILEPLLVIPTSATNVTSGDNFVTLPTGFLQDISVQYYTTPVAVASMIPLYRREKGANIFHRDKNTYFAEDSSNMYYWIDLVNSKLMFGTSASSPNGVYMMTYIKIPTEIDGSTQPILSAFTHETILQYAFSQALLRDQRPEAQNELGKFFQFLQGLDI